MAETNNPSSELTGVPLISTTDDSLSGAGNGAGRQNAEAGPRSLEQTPLTIWETSVLCIGSASGLSGALTVPLWVGAIIKSGLLSASIVGWLVSAQSLAMGIGIFAVVLFRGRTKLGMAVVALSLVSVAANLIAMISTIPTLLLGRVLCGLATGGLLALTGQSASLRPKAQRVFALMEIAALAFGSVIYFFAPNLIDRFGVRGVFALLVVAGLVTAGAAFLKFPTLPERRPGAPKAAITHRFAALVLALGWALVFASQNTIIPYIITIGDHIGFDGHAMANILAVAFPLSALGPVAGHWLGERFGLFKPVFCCVALLALNITLLAFGQLKPIFPFLVTTLSMWGGFGGPYVGALFGQLDKSGRFAGLVPAFGLIGVTVGAASGGYLVDGLGTRNLAFAASLGALCSLGCRATNRMRIRVNQDENGRRCFV